jgi:hypothetical protein
VEIPEPVRAQALHPFRELPVPPGCENIEREHLIAHLHPFPIAQVVEPNLLEPDDVADAVEDARTVLRGRGKSLLIWLVGLEYPWLGTRLEELGLANDDTPGFESVENSMALVEPPAGTVPDDVELKEVGSFEEFATSNRISAEVFEMTPAMRDEMEADLPRRYEEHLTPGNPLRVLVASLGGRPVGTAAAALGPAGVNLFGGCVLADARGRGVYRALTFARWELAVSQGTPALTIQAGRMSRPIAERLGFESVGANHVYVDDFSADGE